MKKTGQIIRKIEQNDGFFRRVYAFLEKIPAGKVVTYGDVAAAVEEERRRAGRWESIGIGRPDYYR